MRRPLLNASLRHGVAALALGAATSALAEPLGGRWEVEVTPAVWASGLSGDVHTGPPGSGAGASFASQGHRLRPAILSIEAGKADYGILLDVVHIDLTHQAPALPQGAAGAVVGGRHDAVQLAAAARMAFAPGTDVDLIGGLRYVSVSLDPGAGAQPAPSLARDARWTDAFVGLRWAQQLAERAWFQAGADLGAGGSMITWQGQLGAQWRISDGVTAKLGYRVLRTRYDKPGFVYDLTSSGVYAGMGLRF
jgi:opacity protein-like surface antigen